MNHEIAIHLDWNGPLTLNEARSCNGDTDWGVYQIYGFHPTYGTDVLLYIGKAAKQHFGTRLSQETWWDYGADSDRMRVYLGRLAGDKEAPDDATWCRQIELAERLLIFVHRPAWNAQKGIARIDHELQQVHVLNWGFHRSLLPEVSGARWSSRLDSMAQWHVFKWSGSRLAPAETPKPND